MIDKLSQYGYRDDSPYRKRKKILIKGNGLIDMSNTGIPLKLEDEMGNIKYVNPYSGMHQMIGNVMETPMQGGGLYDSNKSAYVDSVFSANKNLNFVQRYLNPKDYPAINNSDGSYSTHMMASSDNFSYPTIIQDNTGKLIKMNPEEAYQYAMKNKQYIQFPKEEQANWFSNNGYKKGKQYKMGGNPYAKGGRAQVLNYLLNDLFQEDDTKNSTVSSPTVEEVSNPDNSDEQQQRDDILRQAREQQDYDLSLQIAMGNSGNPYTTSGTPIHQSDHPFRAANEDLYSKSKELEGMSYGFGQEGQNGKVDCSGAVCKMLGIPRTTSEEIVANSTNFRQFTGDLSTIKEGTVIGVNSGNRPWEGQRKYGIDHVLLVVKNPKTGKLETKSSSGSKGFHTESLEQSLKTYGKYNLYLGDYK